MINLVDTVSVTLDICAHWTVQHNVDEFPRPSAEWTGVHYFASTPNGGCKFLRKPCIVNQLRHLISKPPEISGIGDLTDADNGNFN